MKKTFILTAFMLPLLISPAFAVDDDDDQSGVLIKNIIMRTGLLGANKPEIKYQERPPLVLPPSVTGKAAVAALPSPAQPASKQSQNWPKDHDALKAEKAEARKKKPTNFNDSARKMTSEELNRGARGAAVGGGAEPYKMEDDKINPTAGKGKLFKLSKDENERIAFTGEKPRTSLIEPPSGYKTPAASRPYGPVGRTDYEPIVEVSKDARKQ
jgi:hypothetical protein